MKHFSNVYLIFRVNFSRHIYFFFVYMLCIYVFIVCGTSDPEVGACRVYVKTAVLYITVAIFRATHTILKLAVTVSTETLV
jgi:hypothetical protein